MWRETEPTKDKGCFRKLLNYHRLAEFCKWVQFPRLL